MKDPHEVEACRRVWASVLMHNTRDAIRAQIIALKGYQRRGTDADISWIRSRSFLEVCILAGLDDATELRRRMLDKMQTLEGCIDLMRKLNEPMDRAERRRRLSAFQIGD